MDHKMIRSARRSKGMTQEELAKKLGINRATLSRYETGDIDPPTSQIEKIFEILDISPLELITSEEKEEVINVLDTIREHEHDQEKLEKYEKGLALEILNNRPILECCDARERADSAILDAFKHVSDQDIRSWSIDYLDNMNRSGRIEALQILEALSEVPRYNSKYQTSSD